MRIDPSSSASNPFHIARAYGLAAPRAVKPVTAVPAGKVEAVRFGRAGVEAESAESSGAVELKQRVRGLVGAVVPGRVDFSGAEARHDPDSLPMYRHPAERNAAATGVALGRVLDVRG